MKCLIIATYGILVNEILAELYEILSIEERIDVLRNILRSCFFVLMGFSRRCWNHWVETLSSILNTRILYLHDLDFYKELKDEFKIMLAPSSEIYTTSVPLIQLDSNTYLGPGIIFMETSFDKLENQGSLISKIYVMLTEKLESNEHVYHVILSILGIPPSIIKSTYHRLTKRREELNLQAIIAPSFAITSSAIICRDDNGCLHMYLYMLEPPGFDLKEDIVGQLKRCIKPTDIINVLYITDLYISISSRITLSSLAMLLDLYGFASFNEISKYDPKEYEKILEPLYDVTLHCIRRLIDVRELLEFTKGKVSRYSELAERFGIFPNENIERCVTNIGILGNPKSGESLIKAYKEACGYNVTLQYLETALTSLSKSLNTIQQSIYNVITLKGLREQIEWTRIAAFIALATALVSILLGFLH